MVGHQTLDLGIVVRVHTGQLNLFFSPVWTRTKIRGLLRGKDRFPLKLSVFIAKEGMTASRRRAPEGKPLGFPMGRSGATTGSSEAESTRSNQP